MYRQIHDNPELQALLSQVIECTGAEESSLLLQAEEGLIFAACHSPVADKLQGKKLAHGKGIVGLCYSFQQPMAINHVQHDPAHDPSMDKITGVTTRTEAVVPVSDASEEHGCLTAINTHNNNGFSTNDLSKMTDIADEIATLLCALRKDGQA